MSNTSLKYIVSVIILLLGIQVQAQEIIGNNDTCKLIDNYLTQLENDYTFSGGLLIVKGGKKVFSKGYGYSNRSANIPFSTSTLASMGSITKSFTAVAILKLYQQRKLDLKDPLSRFFNDVPADKSTITIHQLLTHSSGFTEMLEGDKGDYEKIETNAYLQRAFKQPLAFKPGTKAIYTNVGMSILGIIIEKISGMSYEDFLQKEIFGPIGIQHLGYQYPVATSSDIAHGYQDGKDWGTHQSHFKETGGGPYWNLKANGGLEVSLDEMYTWINAISNYSILPDSLTQLMFVSHMVEEGTDGFYHFGYGCNISTSRRNTKVIDNGGSNRIYFARLLRLPEENLCFYMVSNESSINTNMVLPNIIQLYFYGKIIDDALLKKQGFEFPMAKEIYDLIKAKGIANFEDHLKKAGIIIENDMALLEAGHRLTDENLLDDAIGLYIYYTKTFPNIIVAHNDLGDLYKETGQKEKAIECYRNALRINPKNERALNEIKNLQ